MNLDIQKEYAIIQAHGTVGMTAVSVDIDSNKLKANTSAELGKRARKKNE